jgi:hypothetical protein
MNWTEPDRGSTRPPNTRSGTPATATRTLCTTLIQSYYVAECWAMNRTAQLDKRLNDILKTKVRANANYSLFFETICAQQELQHLSMTLLGAPMAPARYRLLCVTIPLPRSSMELQPLFAFIFFERRTSVMSWITCSSPSLTPNCLDCLLSSI